MFQKVISFIFFLIISQCSIACICTGTKSFDILEYDKSANVLEIEILEESIVEPLESDEDYQLKIDKYEREIKDWNKSYPPPPKPPRMPSLNYEEYKIKINQVYKGEIEIGEFILKTENKYSSCHWSPEIGMKYIYYFSEKLMDEGKEYLQINPCDRKIPENTKVFQSEQKILEIFKARKKGRINLNQSEIIEDRVGGYISLKVKFKNQKRHGRWEIYMPLFYSDFKIDDESLIAIIKYKKGKFIKLKIEEYKNKSDSAKRYINNLTLFYELGF